MKEKEKVDGTYRNENSNTCFYILKPKIFFSSLLVLVGGREKRNSVRTRSSGDCS